jgi:papain like cysteine protease AvrRpt2
MGHIYYDVPMIQQGDNPICWIACVAMITSFKTKTLHSISEFTGGFDPSNSCIPDPNKGWNDLYANLSKFGFTADGSNVSIGPDYIENMLRRRGPFMIFVNAADFPFYGPFCVNVGGTHAVVVSGVDTTPGKVMIVNPWGTKTPPADADIIVKLMQDITDQNLSPAAYMQ